MSKDRLTSGPDFVERPRKKQSKPKAKFDFADILSGNLQVTLNLSDHDREAVLSKLEEIADKVDYRWKWTQTIMVAAILLSAIGQIITWSL